MNRRTIILLGWFTLLVFSTIGCLFIYWWVNPSVEQHFMGCATAATQLMFGLSFGAGAGLLAVTIVRLPFLIETNNYYSELINSINLSKKEIVFLSFCAGIGEEILFRGALQPLFGLWPVAIVFVAIHGYLNPFDWKLSIYGIYMVFISAGFGYLFSNFGIWAATSAHFTFDVIMFSYLNKKKSNI
ncbi:MAG: CPBP family intramembrane metalloprotease [Flavobacteriales bacterium]|nr:CPBP family intramembrane metalloprotease [Flavobacteriales bacterium]